MRALRQLVVLVRLSAQSIRQRVGASLVVIAGVAGVVAVLLSVLAISGTLMKSIQGTGDPTRALVLSEGAAAEGASTLSRDAVRLIRSAPGLRRADGDSIVSAEVLFVAPVRDVKSNARAQIIVRGATMPATAFRREIRIVEGREPRSGVQELLVGTAASRKYRSLKVGDAVSIRGNRWPIVGRFDAGGSSRESELFGDAETLLSANQRNSYNVVYVQLANESTFTSFRDGLTLDPALSVKVMREPEYYRIQTEPIAKAWNFVAYIVSGIMALGAMFGAANTMYSSVSARTKEIATLRAIGFGGAGVVGSVLIEVTALAVIGALLGSCIVWLLFGGMTFSTKLGAGRVIAQLSLDPLLVLLGVAWACGIGLIGGLFPAVRAARLPVADALRDM